MTEGPSPRAGSHADPPLVPVEQHLADVLAAIRPVEPAWVPLAGALGTVLAEHVTASTPLPSFDNSAMDGYAVRAADLAWASAETPVTLEVRGEIAAGDTGDYRVEAGACLQIMTGARLPEGADAVVPVEWTDGGTVSQPSWPSATAPSCSMRSATAATTWLRARSCCPRAP